MSGTLAGHVILVTGGESGIGAATGRAAAREGAHVAIAYLRDKDSAGQVVDGIRDLGVRCEGFYADVSDGNEVRRMVGEVEETFGKIDGLVNNAGVAPTTPFLKMDDQTWDRVLRTNLYSAFYCSRAVLPGMVERGSGTIVMVSSRMGQIGWPEVAHYCASKAGVIGLTRALAREFGPLGVRVNAVAPGVTNTDIGRKVMTGEVGRRRLEEMVLGRFPEPEDVAEAILFLLSDASILFFGQTLNPNGGAYMP